MVPINVHVYFFNLTLANQIAFDQTSASNVWAKLFDYKTEYNLKNLSPSSIKDLL